jgi:hypothetical protein
MRGLFVSIVLGCGVLAIAQGEFYASLDLHGIFTVSIFVVTVLFIAAEIYEINENNLAYEPIHIIEWAKKELVSADLIRYEKENQNKLCQIMKQLDNVEKELFEGSDSQCQRKSENAEDRPKTKSKSKLMKVLSRLKCKNTNNL